MRPSEYSSKEVIKAQVLTRSPRRRRRASRRSMLTSPGRRRSSRRLWPASRRIDEFRGFRAQGAQVQDKLASLGIEVVEQFIEETLGITRATIAEADKFPALSRHVHEAGRDQAAAAVSHVLNDATHTLSRGSKGPFSGKRSLATAQIFMDLILLPMLMRALMGEGAKELRSELPAFVRERVSFFWRPVKRIGEGEALARRYRRDAATDVSALGGAPSLPDRGLRHLLRRRGGHQIRHFPGKDTFRIRNSLPRAGYVSAGPDLAV